MSESRDEGKGRTGDPRGPELPSGWDFGRDLAVLVGGGSAAREAWFRERGQARLLVFAPEEASHPPPDGAIRPASEAELVLAILQLQGPQPAHVVVLRSADPRVTSDRHRHVARVVGDALRSRAVQAGTVARSGLTWLRQGIANLSHVSTHPSVSCLRGAFRGLPCLLVSPGPSLARNVDRIPDLVGRALVVAGTHALGALARVGVRPDLLLCADPGDLVRHLRGHDVAEIPALLVAATCRREVFELPARRIFSFAGNGALDGWIYEGLGEDAALPTGGSVACTALSLALAVQCDPILLVGQDLSFSEGRFYAPGTLDEDAEVVLDEGGSFHLKKPEGTLELRDAGGNLQQEERLANGGVRFTNDQELVTLPGYHGGTVRSSRVFQAFHTWFEAVARAVAGTVRILNCTEGGARIAGMEELPLAAASAGWPPLPEPVEAVLDRAGASVAPEERRGRMRSHVRGMLAALDPSLALARRCRALAEEAGEGTDRLEELGRAEKELARALRPVQLFSLVAQDEIVAAQERARVARDLSENLAAARALFDVVTRSVELLREPLHDALAELSG